MLSCSYKCSIEVCIVYLALINMQKMWNGEKSMVNKKGLSVNRPSYWPHPRMNIRGFCFGNKIGRLEEWGLNKFLVIWQGPFEKKKKNWEMLRLLSCFPGNTGNFNV